MLPIVQQATETPTKQPQMPDDEKEKLYMALQATFIVAARILAIRLFLFFSIIGSFVLALIATGNQSPLWVNLLYACATTLPLSVLEFAGKRTGG